MTRHETAALNLAREVVRLLGMWEGAGKGFEGPGGPEDVADALAVLADSHDLAETLLFADRSARGGMTDERAGLWGAWKAGLLDSTPETFSDGSGIKTGLVWWSGLGSEASVRRAVGGAA